MHHQSPAFRKYKPGIYKVFFTSGMEEEIQADSQRDAMLKTSHLQGQYGPFKKAHMKGTDHKSKRKPKEKLSYAKSQAILWRE